MNSNKQIEILIQKYFNGETTLEEEKQLHVFFNREALPAEFESYRDQFEALDKMKGLNSSLSDDDLFSKLDEKVQGETSIVTLKPSNGWLQWTYRIAAAIAFVLVGFWVGGQFGSNQYVNDLRAELNELKSQLNTNSASTRLQVVNDLTRQSNEGDEVILTLLAVLKNDPNMHVRTKAVEAIAEMGNGKDVVNTLADALLEESEPAVQIAIINALVKLESADGIAPLEKLTEEGKVLKEVRDEAHLAIFKLREM